MPPSFPPWQTTKAPATCLFTCFVLLSLLLRRPVRSVNNKLDRAGEPRSLHAVALTASCLTAWRHPVSNGTESIVAAAAREREMLRETRQGKAGQGKATRLGLIDTSGMQTCTVSKMHAVGNAIMTHQQLALTFTLLNGAILWVRIREENRALRLSQVKLS